MTQFPTRIKWYLTVAGLELPSLNSVLRIRPESEESDNTDTTVRGTDKHGYFVPSLVF